ncbi:hypothetical protein, partial [Mesorhizobium sp. M0103]|uniref:hypothetical protein n=1 Tax=Mesorhizobium sp. M0103 TaxID=2956879 RepID=UPI00333A6DBB
TQSVVQPKPVEREPSGKAFYAGRGVSETSHLAPAKTPVVRWKRTTGHLDLFSSAIQDCGIAAAMVTTC